MTDVTKIKVGQHKVGIIGIKQVLSEMANECGGISDEEIQMELLNRLSKFKTLIKRRRLWILRY